MIRSRATIAIPPGTTIKEQLENRDICKKEFAKHMEMDEKHIDQLINGDINLTPEIASKLELTLGIPSHVWERLEIMFRKNIVLVKLENDKMQEFNNV